MRKPSTCTDCWNWIYRQKEWIGVRGRWLCKIIWDVVRKKMLSILLSCIWSIWRGGMRSRDVCILGAGGGKLLVSIKIINLAGRFPPRGDPSCDIWTLSPEIITFDLFVLLISFCSKMAHIWTAYILSMKVLIQNSKRTSRRPYSHSLAKKVYPSLKNQSSWQKANRSNGGVVWSNGEGAGLRNEFLYKVSIFSIINSCMQRGEE